MTASDGFDLLVPPQWLAGHLGDPDLFVLDASWYLPAMNRDGHGEFLAAHIPGAAFFDIDAVSDQTSALPHMLPSPENFARDIGALGVGDGCRVVVYDGAGLFSAPRVWWMLRIFGLREVAILDGGFPAWKTGGYPTEAGAVHKAPRHFTPRFDTSAVVRLEDVRGVLLASTHKVLDARPSERFLGRAPEPRPRQRTYARQPQPAVVRSDCKWAAEIARGTAGPFRVSRRRWFETRHHKLRFGSLCGHHYPGHGTSRPSNRPALRRLLD